MESLLGGYPGTDILIITDTAILLTGDDVISLYYLVGLVLIIILQYYMYTLSTSVW